MIAHELDTENSILLVRPESALDKEDFVQLAELVDPQIEATGDLAGLIIDAPGFPGWDISARWLPTSDSFAIITSASRKSRSSPTLIWGMSPST